MIITILDRISGQKVETRAEKRRRLVESDAFVNGMDIDIKSIDKVIAEKAAQIRAEYKFFKTMNALQLATAWLSGCDLFLINDKQLKQFKEIKCITVEELL